MKKTKHSDAFFKMEHKHKNLLQVLTMHALPNRYMYYNTSIKGTHVPQHSTQNKSNCHQSGHYVSTRNNFAYLGSFAEVVVRIGGNFIITILLKLVFVG